MNRICSYHSSHMFKQKDQKRRHMLSPDWLSGDQVSVKLWIELQNASVKLNINWNSQAATAQQNSVQCPCVLKGGYTLVTLPRIVTPYRDSVDETRARVTYQKLVTR
jgi:hypothetical protein